MGAAGVVCAGGAVADLKLYLRAAAVAATSNPVDADSAFGGVARNVAENLAALGVPVELVSAVGDDAAGAELRKHAAARGIGVSGVAIRPGRTTARYVAVLEPDGGLTIGAAAMAVLDDVDVGALAAAWPAPADVAANGRPGADWLFCDTNLSADVLEYAVLRARRDGTPLAIDAVSTAKATRLPADLRGVRLLCGNRDELRAWLAATGRPDDGPDEDLASRVTAAGAGGVLLTRGEDGVIVADEGGPTAIPAEPARPVDVTGAGDALVAGALAALLSGEPLLNAAAAGVKRAARTVESPLSVLPGQD